MKNLSGAAAIALCVALCGCGQKGALYLPDAPKHKRSIPAIPQMNKPHGDVPPAGDGPGGAPAADKGDPDKPAQPPAPSSP